MPSSPWACKTLARYSAGGRGDRSPLPLRHTEGGKPAAGVAYRAGIHHCPVYLLTVRGRRTGRPRANPVVPSRSTACSTSWKPSRRRLGEERARGQGTLTRGRRHSRPASPSSLKPNARGSYASSHARTGRVCVAGWQLERSPSCWQAPLPRAQAAPRPPSLASGQPRRHRRGARRGLAGSWAPGCHPESPVTRWQSFLPQVEGTGHGATLWGLLMFSHALPARAGGQDKIVWRMTGTGLLTLQAIGPDGRRHRLAWHRTRTWAATGISREMSGARAMSSPRRAAGICAPSAVTPPPMCGSAS
jgi:hypothetical protein